MDERRWWTGRSWLGVVAALVALGLVAGACGSSDDGDDGQASADSAPEASPSDVRMQNMEGDLDGEPIDGGRLIWGLEAETDGWNPVVNRWALSGHMVGSAIFDPLVTVDDDGVAVPYLAESITPNDDATEWDITVRQGVRFHDGSPLVAQNVADTLEAHRGSVITSSAVAAIESVEVVDDLTTKVTMSEPWFQFPYVLTTQVGYVVPTNMTQDLSTTNAPVGTGPFVFDEWEPEVRVTTRRNDDYWQAGKPHLAELEFRPIPDASERTEALLDGEIDAMNTWSAADVALFRGQDVKMVEYGGGEERHLVLNTAMPPFDQLDARLAIAHAVDVDRLLTETGTGDVLAASGGPWAPDQLGFREDSGAPGYDPDLAREYAAAYEEATGEPLAFTYLGANNIEDLQRQNSLKAMWEEAGIDVTVETVSQDDLILNAALGLFEAADFRNFGATDPDGETVWWQSRSIPEDPAGVSINFARWGDPAIDAALMEGRSTDDPAVRDEAYAEVARLLNEDAPLVFLERVTWAVVADPRVHGIGAAANGSLQTLGTKTWIADLWVG